jgi:hypothetical protein
MSYLKLSDTPGYTPAVHECKHVRHLPPLAALTKGTWRWSCPACGAAVIFDVVEGEVVGKTPLS